MRCAPVRSVRRGLAGNRTLDKPPPRRTRRLTAFATTQGALTLTVGYHEVEGKLTALKKPLVVLSRVETGGAGETAYEAVGVIRKKFNFKNRPKALISAVEPGKRLKTAQSAAMRSFFGQAKFAA